MLYCSVLCCVCDEACCVDRQRCTKFVVKSWLGVGIRRERISIKPLTSLCAYIRRSPLLHSQLTIGLYMVRLYSIYVVLYSADMTFP